MLHECLLIIYGFLQQDIPIYNALVMCAITSAFGYVWRDCNK